MGSTQISKVVVRSHTIFEPLMFFRYPAELHLVHVKENYVMDDGTVDYAGAFGSEDGLAVLGIFIEDSALTLSVSNAWFEVSL